MKLQPNEKTLAIFRKHWLTLAIEGVILALIAVFPLICEFVAEVMLGWTIPEQYRDGYEILFLLWILFIWISFFISWTNYTLDIWVLTNERLVDIEQLGLFSRRESALDLEKVQDITIETDGILNTIIKSGSVIVQTAGTERDFVIKNMMHPELVKDLVTKAYQAKQDAIKTVRVQSI